MKSINAIEDLKLIVKKRKEKDNINDSMIVVTEGTTNKDKQHDVDKDEEDIDAPEKIMLIPIQKSLLELLYNSTGIIGCQMVAVKAAAGGGGGKSINSHGKISSPSSSASQIDPLSSLNEKTDDYGMCNFDDFIAANKAGYFNTDTKCSTPFPLDKMNIQASPSYERNNQLLFDKQAEMILRYDEFSKIQHEQHMKGVTWVINDLTDRVNTADADNSNSMNKDSRRNKSYLKRTKSSSVFAIDTFRALLLASANNKSTNNNNEIINNNEPMINRTQTDNATGTDEGLQLVPDSGTLVCSACRIVVEELSQLFSHSIPFSLS